MGAFYALPKCFFYSRNMLQETIIVLFTEQLFVATKTNRGRSVVIHNKIIRRMRLVKNGENWKTSLQALIY